MYMKYIIQHTVVIPYPVSGQPIGSIFRGQEIQEERVLEILR
jgi:hypothetical protein